MTLMACYGPSAVTVSDPVLDEIETLLPAGTHLGERCAVQLRRAPKDGKDAIEIEVIAEPDHRGWSRLVVGDVYTDEGGELGVASNGMSWSPRSPNPKKAALTSRFRASPRSREPMRARRRAMRVMQAMQVPGNASWRSRWKSTARAARFPSRPRYAGREAETQRVLASGFASRNGPPMGSALRGAALTSRRQAGSYPPSSTRYGAGGNAPSVLRTQRDGGSFGVDNRA